MNNKYLIVSFNGYSVERMVVEAYDMQQAINSIISVGTSSQQIVLCKLIFDMNDVTQR